MSAEALEDLDDFYRRCSTTLRSEDSELANLLRHEYFRQNNSLVLVAAAGLMDPSVMACTGSVLENITSEGYPDCRFHGGSETVDHIERLAIARAKTLFGAQYANVQPHSGTSANLAVMASLLSPGDKILGLDIRAGGHLSHGANASITGQYFTAIAYGLNAQGLIDYEQVRQLAQRHRPKLIVCGASAYPRRIDFARFRAIADTVGALLLADVSHIAGLIVAKQHPSPIDYAHVTTTSTYKQLNGPRGGLILAGRDAANLVTSGQEPLAQLLQRAVFPLCQGTPNFAAIAAKARALDIAASANFRALIARTVENAQALASELTRRGYSVVTGGTDTHMVLLDLRPTGLTGIAVERALESCGIISNRNTIPGDSNPPKIASGIRFGTNVLAQRGLGPNEMAHCAQLIETAINAMSSSSELTIEMRRRIGSEVLGLCQRFPLPGHVFASRTRDWAGSEAGLASENVSA
ncbi:serine hydroxymethyltransferase [Bradyrhizobium neotropicale]|uniref:Probable serine hydroxymethyltransferase n=1 Tax=Bradyrhizobium neotropicale TaxID=1497615 RepID=A0A176ZGA8_9BRAD|nr:serine hydroxymethyltransferase [Bradyrhizobium neotropicale]OAF19711.1 serine hydroxymethyltransferase [Bradyrhizobium neotropicale]